MSTQTTLQIKIEKGLKDKVSKVFKDKGLNLSSGIKLFLTEVASGKTTHFLSPSSKGKKLLHYDLYKKEVAEAKKNDKSYTSSKELIDDILNS